jgi:hypothetical protein
MTQPPIPATDSISELAAFWSTHDLTDYEDELEAVEGRVFERHTDGRDLLLHLDPEEAVTVREAARAKGIDEAAIVREWIREHAPKIFLPPRSSQPYAAFHREAATLEDAIRTAIRDVQAAGCRVVRCEIDGRQLAAY